MIDEVTGVDSPTVAVDSPTTPDLQSEIDKLKGINLSLIESRDNAKSKLAQFVDADEAQKLDALKANEKYKEAYTTLSTKYESLQSEVSNNRTLQILRKELVSQGIGAVDTAIKLIDLNALQIDTESNTISNIDSVVSTLKSDHDVLFQSSTPVTPVIPSDGSTHGGGVDAEIDALMKSGRPTQTQLDAILRKYN